MEKGLTLQELQAMGAKPQQQGLTLDELNKLKQNPLDGFAQAEPNYFQRVGSQLMEQAKGVISSVEQSAETLQDPNAGLLEKSGNLLRTGLRAAGSVAGGAFAPITEAPIIKPIIEKTLGKALENQTVRGLVTTATDLSKKYPNASKDLQNIIDIATLGGGKVAEAPLRKEIGLIGKDLSQATRVALNPSEEVVQRNIVELFNKSIKPTAKKTLGQSQKYENDTLNALKTIKANANDLNVEDAAGEIITGRTPQTIQELSQALDQTKDVVFKQYDDLAKQAGSAGVVVDAKPIADEILKVTQNKAIQLKNPELIKYAENWAERLKNFDVIDTETTQEVIKMFNNELKAFYSKPSYELASRSVIDAGIANNFMQALDKVIETATGKEYQTLKNQYSALKAIENDVVRAAARDAKRNAKGLLDYTDILTSGQMIGGIISLNPAMFTQGAIERGFKEYIKFLNDPNRAIKNIFDSLDINTVEKFTPQSSTGKYLQNPKLGLSIEDVSKTAGKADDNLIQEARKYKSAEEFVNGQGETVYRASEGGFNASKIGSDGTYVTPSKTIAESFSDGGKRVVEEFYISPSAKVLEWKDVPEKFKNFDGKDIQDVQSQLAKYAKEKGYDVVASEPKFEYSRGIEQQVINPDILKTKSQLTDIWKKANNK